MKAEILRPLSAPPPYSPSEEMAHSLSHGFGAIISVVGLVGLVTRASDHGTTVHVASCAIFSAALILMYVASTLYHSVAEPQLKTLLRKVDQSAVYLLIAGTYTPLCLVILNGIAGWLIFAAVWSISLLGIFLCVFKAESHERYALTLYLSLGWGILLAFRPLMTRMDVEGVALIFGGGLCYTLGTLFYLREERPYFHAIWHLFVLAGSALHYFLMYRFVIPNTSA